MIHSFWVPALNRKIDMIPGLRNRVLLYASSPGATAGSARSSAACSTRTWRCTSTRSRWRSTAPGWRTCPRPARRRRAPRRARQAPVHDQRLLELSPDRRHARAGRRRSGPRHLASRATLAAGTIPNTRSELAAWIAIRRRSSRETGCRTSGCRPKRCHRWWPTWRRSSSGRHHHSTGRAPHRAPRADLDRAARSVGWLTTTDHKRIGILYFFTALASSSAPGEWRRC